MQQEKQEEALNSYNEGLKIIEELVGKDGDNDDWKSVLAYSHMKLGELFERKAEWKEALEHYERAYEIREKLFEKAKENADWKREYCVSLYLVGGAYGRELATSEKGKEMCGKAVELARELVKKEYIVIRWYYSLASALYKKGDVENRGSNRNTVEIRKLWEEALAIVDERLLSKTPKYWYYKELKAKLEKGLAEVDQS